VRILSDFGEWIAGSFGRVKLLRSMMAPHWRRVLRALVVSAGFAIYLVAQLGVGYAVGHDRTAILAIAMFAISMLVVSAIWPIVGLVALIVVTPLARGFLGVSGGSLPDITFDSIMVPALALVVLFRKLSESENGAKLNTPICLLVLYVAYCAANLWLRGSASLNNYRGIIQYVGFWPMVYFIVVGIIKTDRHVRIILSSLVVLAFGQGCALIVEHFTGYAYVSIFYGRAIPLAWLGWADIGEGRAVGLFQGPVAPSVFMAASVLIAMHLSGLTRNRAAKLFCWLTIAIIFLGSFFTYTRNIYIMLALSVLIMPFMAARNRRTYALIALTAVMLVAVMAPIWMENTEFSNRLTNVRNIDARVEMNGTAINLINDNLWFGIGWGNYTAAVVKYFTSAAQLIGSVSPTTGKMSPLTVHNTYLFVLSEEGVIGATLYFGSLLGFLAMMWQYRQRSKPDSGLIGKDLFSIIFIYIGLLFIQFVPYSNYDTQTNLITWMLLGLGVQAFQLQNKTATAGRVEAA